MTKHRLVGALIALLGLTHCGSDDDDGGKSGSGGSSTGGTSGNGGTSGSGTGGASGDSGTDADASSSTTKTIGPEGGTITHPDGAELEVPPGALAAPVELAIEKDPTGAPALSPMYAAYGGVYAITPHGTAFSQPATVRIPFDATLVPAGITAELHSAEEGGKYASLAGSTVNGDRLEAQISSLSYFVTGGPFGYIGEITPYDVATYPGGGAVVIGQIPGEFEVVKVNELGAESWRRKVMGSMWFSNALPRVAVGPTGNVYAASTTEKDESGVSLGGGSRLRVMAFNPSGDPRPGFPVQITLAYDNVVGDIITDSQDNVYVVGTTAPAGGANHDAYRPFLASFTEGGAVKDAATIVDIGGTDPGRRIFAHSVAIAPNGSIYMNAQVVGFVVPGSSGTRLTAFDLLGAVAPNYPMELSKSSNWSKLAVSQTGIAYVVEPEEQLYAINPNGSPVSGFPQPVTLPTDGNFQFSSSANPSIAVSVVGNIYLIGGVQEHPDVQGDGDAWLQSLDSTGAQRAGFPVFLGTADWDTADAVTVDDAGGNVWVAWHAETVPRKGYVTRVPAL
jgi:hypothetical protein